jgi:hypothetical protein
MTSLLTTYRYTLRVKLALNLNIFKIVLSFGPL